MEKAKSKPHIMSICWSCSWLLGKNYGRNVVIRDGTLFCRLRAEDEETSSKWNMLIDFVFCLCCNLFWSCSAYVVLYGDKTVSVNLLHRRRRNQECESCWNLLCLCWICTNGMVLVMFGFFCRSGNPINISRWVKLCVNLTCDICIC